MTPPLIPCGLARGLEPERRPQVVIALGPLGPGNLRSRIMGELTDKIKGNANEAAGNIKQHSGNPATRKEGEAQERKGEVQQLEGEIKGALGDDI